MATKYTQFEIENVLKENDIELADPNIKWDDVLGEYTLI